MRGREITTDVPFNFTTVTVFPDGTMPISHFARAIGSRVSTIKKRASVGIRQKNTSQYIGSFGQRIHKVILLDAIEPLLRGHYKYSEEEVQSAMKQLRDACDDARQLIPFKKRSRESEEEEEEEWHDDDEEEEEEEEDEEDEGEDSPPPPRPKPTPRLLVPKDIQAAFKISSSPPPPSPIEENVQDFFVQSQFKLTEEVSGFIKYMQTTMNNMMSELTRKKTDFLQEYLQSEEFKTEKSKHLEKYLQSEQFIHDRNAEIKKVVQGLTESLMIQSEPKEQAKTVPDVV